MDCQGQTLELFGPFLQVTKKMKCCEYDSFLDVCDPSMNEL
jgi:hypothetical protein